MSSKLNDVQKQNLYDDFETGVYTKVALSTKYDVSARTVGRVLAEIDKKTLDENEVITTIPVEYDVIATTPVEPVEGYDYIVFEDNPVVAPVEWADINGGTEAVPVVAPVEPVVASATEQDRFTVVITDMMICIVDTVEIGTYTLTASDPRFAPLLAKARATTDLQSFGAEAIPVISIEKAISKFTEGNIQIDAANDTAFYQDSDGNKMDLGDSIKSRLVDAIKTGDSEASISAICKFAEKLIMNPAKKVVDELYQFLNANDIKIDEEGYVICYKKITDDYKDCYTKKVDNSIGAKPKMPRVMVDDNSNNTCSHGYHVCSYAYLNSYSGARVVMCRVDPANFVSIPAEYYYVDGQGKVKAKARVCEYEVIEEVTDYLNGKVRGLSL